MNKLKITLFLTMLLNVSLAFANETDVQDSLACSNTEPETSVAEFQPQSDTLASIPNYYSYRISPDAVNIKPLSSKEKFGSYTPLTEFEVTSIPLVAFGFIAKGNKANFRAARNNFIPSYKNRFDDWLQHGPLIMTSAMNIAGYEGRSNLKRYLVSGVASYAMMGIFVNSIKYTAKEMRPDGSTANSFPSGHTATAFTAATIMHKEYGLTRSPWWSVLAYGCATTTGIMRTLNNRHWISDILVGAGIGVISTDIGYAIGDLIFKKKGINREKRDNIADMTKSPSFFRLSLGMQSTTNISLPDQVEYSTMERLWSTPGAATLSDDYYTVVRNGNPYSGSPTPRIKASIGTTVGAEGAYFFNPYIGAGLRARITTAPIVAEGINDYKNNPTSSATDIWSIADVSIGAYCALPISTRHNIGAKLMYGRRFFGELDMQAVSDRPYVTPSGDTGFAEVYGDDLWIDKTSSDNFTLGAHYTYSAGSGVALSAFVDYDFSRPEFSAEYSKYSEHAPSIAMGNSSFKFKQKINSITVGASMTVLF